MTHTNLLFHLVFNFFWLYICIFWVTARARYVSKVAILILLVRWTTLQYNLHCSFWNIAIWGRASKIFWRNGFDIRLQVWWTPLMCNNMCFRKIPFMCNKVQSMMDIWNVQILRYRRESLMSRCLRGLERSLDGVKHENITYAIEYVLGSLKNCKYATS